jgi:hypothetical protein
MCRVSRRGEAIDDAGTIAVAWVIFRGQPPGRHGVDEIRSEPRRLTRATRRGNGGIRSDIPGRVRGFPSAPCSPDEIQCCRLNLQLDERHPRPVNGYS